MTRASAADHRGRRFATVDTGGPADVFPGSLVTWIHVPRGGYGFDVPIPAKVCVVARRPRTWVVIEVTTRRGALVKRRVDVASLRVGHP